MLFSNQTFKHFSMYYHKLGINISFILDDDSNYEDSFGNFLKVPSSEWNKYKQIRQSLEYITLKDYTQVLGLGIILDYGKIVCIDIDNCVNDCFLKHVLDILKLPHDYEWVIRTGSRTGFHIIIKTIRFNYDNYNEQHKAYSFYVNENHEMDAEKLEIIWEYHSILPPSLHKTGKNYEFYNDELPSSFPETINNKLLLDLLDSTCNQPDKIFDINSIERRVSWISEESKTTNSNWSIVIDIETNGLIGENVKYYELSMMPEVFQIAWIITDGEKIIFKESSLISDIEMITHEIQTLTGINKEICLKAGRPLKCVLKLLHEDIKKVKRIVAHNTEFDLKILKSIFFKEGIIIDWKELGSFCTMKKGLEYKKYISNYNNDGWLSLNTLYEKLYPFSKTNLKDLHNAEVDVLLAYKCYKKLIKIQKNAEFGNEDSLSKIEEVNDLPF